MKHLTLSTLSLCLAFALPGAAAAYDCANAPNDIQRLQAEKDSTAERAAKGITAILPIGAVIHTMEGDEMQTLDEMSTDDHNKQLDARIAQIKAECKLQ